MTPREQIIHTKAMKETILNIYAAFGDHRYPYYVINQPKILFENEEELYKFISEIDFDDDIAYISAKVRGKLCAPSEFFGSAIRDDEVAEMFTRTLDELNERVSRLTDETIQDGLTDALDL